MAAAINNNLGSLLTNTYATPSSLNQSGIDKGADIIDVATCAIPTSATDLAGSQYRFCQVGSADIPLTVWFASTALTAGAISLGLYSRNTGAAVSVNLFATSINCASAVAKADQRYTNLSIATGGQRVWQLLGLSSDPGLVYDLVGTSTTAATAAGTLLCQYEASR